MRIKKIGPVAAKVYAAGLYVNKGAAQRALKPVVDTVNSAGDLAKSRRFEDGLSSANFDRSVVLKMARSVGSEKMVDAIAESLKPRIRGDNAALNEFQSVLLKGLADGGAKSNMVLSFKTSGSNLQVSINGKAQGQVIFYCEDCMV